MLENKEENKKSFLLIYILVALFYVAMIITYGFVVHWATDNGAKDQLCDCKIDVSEW